MPITTFAAVIWFRNNQGHVSSTVIPKVNWLTSQSLQQSLSTILDNLPVVLSTAGVPIASQQASFKAFWYSENVFVENSSYSPRNDSLLIVIEKGIFDENIDLITALVEMRFPELVQRAKNIQETIQETAMDIMPFVPIILEATKFIFSEVNKWIAEVRQKAREESSKPVGSSLPLTEVQIAEIELNPETIATLLNQTVTKANIDEIRNLLEQIQRRRAVFLELEKQEITAAGAESAKLRVEIQETAREIINTINRLENALSRIYCSK